MGYSLDEIGFVVKTVALAASIFGFFIGGKLIKSSGVKKSLIVGAFLVMVTNLFFAYIAVSEKSLILLSMVVALDSMAAGIVGTVNITFLTSLVSKPIADERSTMNKSNLCKSVRCEITCYCPAVQMRERERNQTIPTTHVQAHLVFVVVWFSNARHIRTGHHATTQTMYGKISLKRITLEDGRYSCCSMALRSPSNLHENITNHLSVVPTRQFMHSLGACTSPNCIREVGMRQA